MKLFSVVAVAIALCAIACGDEVEKVGTVVGYVSSANNGEPLQGVSLQLSPSGATTTTGSDGHFEFDNITEGLYSIQATKGGFITNTKHVMVNAGETTTADIILTPSYGDMQLNVSQINFGTTGDVRTFQIMNTGSTGSFQWKVELQSAAPWLSVNPTVGSTSTGQQTAITLTADRSKVDGNSTVNLLVTNITKGSSIALPVSIGFDAGNLVVSPTTVDFGTSATQRTLTLKNQSTTAVNYEVSYNSSWLTISPTSGSLASSGSADLTLSCNRSMLTADAQTNIQVRNLNDGSTINVLVKVAYAGGSGGEDIVVSYGLKAYYTFDDGTATDQSANGADATLQGSPTTPAHGSGKCLHIGSGSQYLNIPYNFFKGYSKWSVSFWVKDLTEGCVFAAQNSSGSNDYYDAPVLWANADGKLAIKLHGGYNYTTITYNYSNTANKWRHIVIVASNATVKCYVDGSLVDNTTSSPNTSTINNCTKIVFGGDKSGGYSVAAEMDVDNIRFYGRALSLNEIQSIYNNEL